MKNSATAVERELRRAVTEQGQNLAKLTRTEVRRAAELASAALEQMTTRLAEPSGSARVRHGMPRPK